MPMHDNQVGASSAFVMWFIESTKMLEIMVKDQVFYHRDVGMWRLLGLYTISHWFLQMVENASNPFDVHSVHGPEASRS